MLLKDAHRVLLQNREKIGWEKELSDVNSARGNFCHADASGDVPISTTLPPPLHSARERSSFADHPESTSWTSRCLSLALISRHRPPRPSSSFRRWRVHHRSPVKFASSAPPQFNYSCSRFRLTLAQCLNPLAPPRTAAIICASYSRRSNSPWPPSSTPPWPACSTAPRPLPFAELHSSWLRDRVRLGNFTSTGPDTTGRDLAASPRRRHRPQRRSCSSTSYTSQPRRAPYLGWDYGANHTTFLTLPLRNCRNTVTPPCRHGCGCTRT
jgi:hypothetical protein